MSVELQRSPHQNNVFIVTLYDGWDWHDIERIHKDVQTLSAGEKPVHIITEIDGPIKMPTGIEVHARGWLDTHVSENGGLLVFVTQWGMVKSTLKLLSTTFKLSLGYIHFATSVEDAHRIVRAWEVA